MPNINFNNIKGGLMKIFQGLLFIIAVSLMAGCSEPDPDVQFIVNTVMEDEGWSESDAQCYAKALKKGMKGDQFTEFVAVMKKDEPSMEDMGILMSILPAAFGAAAKCGLSLD